jgi:O-antigen chain-terminating methyltransferase
MSDLSEVAQAVCQLPELYQPVFGHPSLSIGASRTCADRLDQILKVHNAFRIAAGKTARVLDLGCAQGFFALSLAEQGADVVGIDFQPDNIRACRALAFQHPGFAIRFEERAVEDGIENLRKDQFDIVLGLSVFHHLCREHGADYTRRLLAKIASVAEIFLFEAALRSEPVYWSPSLPEDPRWLVQDFALVHKLAEYKTHLSAQQRPLFFCSNRFWYFDGALERFDSWTDKQHELIRNQYAGTRRYYFSPNRLAKQFLLRGPLAKLNAQELARERAFLTSLDSKLSPLPRLIGTMENNEELWLFRELLPGKRLSEMIVRGENYDSQAVLRQILHQLAELETGGMYHNDVRVWNVLLEKSGHAFLIDFGSITAAKEDVAWPFDPFLNFLQFAFDVIHKKIASPGAATPLLPMQLHFPRPYQDWIEAIWRMPRDCWSFAVFLRAFEDTVANPSEDRELPTRGKDDREVQTLPASSLLPWVAAIERQLELLVQCESLVVNAPSCGMPKRTRETDARTQQLEQQLREAEFHVGQLTAQLAQRDAEAAAIFSSKSWRITAPLRKLASYIRKRLRFRRAAGPLYTYGQLGCVDRPRAGAPGAFHRPRMSA